MEVIEQVSDFIGKTISYGIVFYLASPLPMVLTTGNTDGLSRFVLHSERQSFGFFGAYYIMNSVQFLHGIKKFFPLCFKSLFVGILYP